MDAHNRAHGSFTIQESGYAVVADRVASAASTGALATTALAAAPSEGRRHLVGSARNLSFLIILYQVAGVPFNTPHRFPGSRWDARMVFIVPAEPAVTTETVSLL